MVKNVYRIFAGRLVLAAVLISAGLGAAAYLYQQRLLEGEILRMAAAEAQDFARLNPDLPALMLRPSVELAERVDVFLASRAGGVNGHFTMAELYDTARRSLAEAARPGWEDIEEEIDRVRHSFPSGDQPWFDKVTVKDELYVRALLPLGGEENQRLGFFEGVYRVSKTRREDMRQTTLLTVAGVIGVVLATTLFLAPVIVALNRNLTSLSRKLLRANIETLDLMGGAIAKRDSDTHAHNYRVTLYAMALAEAVGLPPATIRELIKGSFLHDVGKIAISDTVLLKPGKLTEEEFAVMKTHVNHGIDIIARSDWLAGADPVVRHHHEKFDGSGYPDGLTGEAIPLMARIFAIADVFDALTSRRPYKEPMPFERAMAILRDSAGSHFDPALVAAFETIASKLYADYGQREDAALDAALDRRVADYFGV